MKKFFKSIAMKSKKSLNTRLNYSVGYKIISANDHGVCQKRERIYIIGFNKLMNC